METYTFIVCVVQLMQLIVGSLGQDILACGGKEADIMFVLDTSGSISYDDFRKEINFTKDVVSMFDVGSQRTHVGVINFSTKVKEEIRLGEINNKAEMLERISSIVYQGGGTHTDAAIHLLRTDVFVPGVMRPEVAHIAIVLTDGMSYNMAKTKAEAIGAKQSGITIFVIGIGSNHSLDMQELADMASEPTKNYMFRIANFDALNSIKSELAIKACKQPPVTTPAPTLPPMMNDQGDIVCALRTPVDVVFAFDISGIGTENAKFILQFIHNMSAEIPEMSERMTVSVISGGCGIRGDRTGSDALINRAHSTEEIDRGFQSLSTRAFNSIMRKMRLNFKRSSRKKAGVLFIDKQLRDRELTKASLEAQYATFQRIDVYVVGIGDRVDEKQVYSLTRGGRNYFHVDRYEHLDTVKADMLCAMS